MDKGTEVRRDLSPLDYNIKCKTKWTTCTPNRWAAAIPTPPSGNFRLTYTETALHPTWVITPALPIWRVFKMNRQQKRE